MRINLSKRVSNVEIVAAPSVKAALEQMQQLREERARKALRWSHFAYWLGAHNPALHKEFREKVLDVLPDDEPELTDEEFELVGFDPIDEIIARFQLSPEQEAIWVKYLDLFTRVTDEVLSDHMRRYTAGLLGLPENTPWADVSAEYARREAASPCHHCTEACELCEWGSPTDA